MQTAFQVAEHHGHGLNARFLAQILQPLFLNFVRIHAVQALLLRLQIHDFEFVVGDRKKIPQFS